MRRLSSPSLYRPRGPRRLWLLALVPPLVGAACSDAGTENSDTEVFIAARTEADMSTFGGVSGPIGTFLVGASFDADEDSVVAVTASAHFTGAEVDGDDPVMVTLWLELATEDDPDRCANENRSETSAFRHATLDVDDKTEISLVSPIEPGRDGEHHLALCASAFSGSVGVGPVALSGIVSSDPDSMATVQIDPS